MDQVCVHCGDAKLQLVCSDCCDSSSDAPGMLLCDNCLWLDKSLYERDVEGRIYSPPHNSREHEPHASSIIGDETRGKANTDSVIPPPAIVSRLSAA